MRSPFRGGPEKRFHARSLVEAEVARGRLGDLTAGDVDSVTCFGSLKWTAIREPYAELLPSCSRREHLCTAQDNMAHLPAGSSVSSDRGAGQSEPSGSLKQLRFKAWFSHVCGASSKAPMLPATLGTWTPAWYRALRDDVLDPMCCSWQGLPVLIHVNRHHIACFLQERRSKTNTCNRLRWFLRGDVGQLEE